MEHMNHPLPSSVPEHHKAPLLGDAPSGTSFYTNERQQDSYPTLASILSSLSSASVSATTTTTSNGPTTSITNRVHQMIYDLLYAIEQISDLLRTSLVYVSGTQNDFGDVQLSVDLQADAILWQMASESSVVHYASSEEEPTLRNMQVQPPPPPLHEEEEGGGGEGDARPTKKKENDGFIICWDPLDGSSIVDNNWAVGTIVGVWPAATSSNYNNRNNNDNHEEDTTNKRTTSATSESSPPWTDGTVTGRDQVTSLVAMYGPRTTILVALEDGTYEFTYTYSPNTKTTTTTTSSGNNVTTTTSTNASVESQEEEEALQKLRRMEHTGKYWICTRSKIQIAPTTTSKCRIFSPANLRVVTELSWYDRIIRYYMQQRYTLRYTGGLVPDLYQQFTKGMGIYMNPISTQSPAKLRLTFEVAPMALLIEKAGGTTSDCRAGIHPFSILDIPITAIDQRTAFCCGTTSEVQQFHTMMMGG
jgi:sedoheptulose-bisphosphatase